MMILVRVFAWPGDGRFNNMSACRFTNQNPQNVTTKNQKVIDPFFLCILLLLFTFYLNFNAARGIISALAAFPRRKSRWSSCMPTTRCVGPANRTSTKGSPRQIHSCTKYVYSVARGRREKRALAISSRWNEYTPSSTFFPFCWLFFQTRAMRGGGAPVEDEAVPAGGGGIPS
jgi:hypothetical protein